MINKLWVIIVMLLMMSPSGAGLFTASTTILPVRQIKVEKQLAEERAAQAIIDAENAAKKAEEEAYNKLHTFLGLTKDEIEGYGRFQTPISHYELNKTFTTDNVRVYNYYDSISRVEFYYVEDLTDNDKANPGKNILGLVDEPEIEKISNDKFDIIHLVSEGDYDGFGRESYIVFKNKSAFIIDAYLTEDTDRTAFRESVDIIIPTINIYYVADVVFDIPNSGYWETFVPKDDTEVEQGNNNGGNTNTGEGYETYVGGDVEGTVRTNLVSSEWKDLRVVIDGLIIDMQDPIDKLLDNGYKYENPDKVPETVASKGVFSSYMYKDNGVALKVTALNTTESSLKPGNLTITKIEIDKDKFGHFTNDSEYTKDNLPELILVNGMTWNIKFDTIKSLNGDSFWTKEEYDGTYVINYDQQVQKMSIKTENYKDIKEVTLEYNYWLAKQKAEKDAEQQAESAAKSEADNSED